MQIMLRRNSRSATAERLFHFCVTVKITPPCYAGGGKIFRYKYELLCYHSIEVGLQNHK